MRKPPPKGVDLFSCLLQAVTLDASEEIVQTSAVPLPDGDSSALNATLHALTAASVGSVSAMRPVMTHLLSAELALDSSVFSQVSTARPGVYEVLAGTACGTPTSPQGAAPYE